MEMQKYSSKHEFVSCDGFFCFEVPLGVTLEELVGLCFVSCMLLVLS